MSWCFVWVSNHLFQRRLPEKVHGSHGGHRNVLVRFRMISYQVRTEPLTQKWKRALRLRNHPSEIRRSSQIQLALSCFRWAYNQNFHFHRHCKSCKVSLYDSVWVSLKVGATPQSHPLSHGLSWFITVYHHLPISSPLKLHNVALLRPRSLGAGQGSSIILLIMHDHATFLDGYVKMWISKMIMTKTYQNWGSKNLAWSKHEPFKILTIG